MKYVFGINVEKNKKNRVMDGYVFHSASASFRLREAYEHCDRIRECNKIKIRFPIWLQIIHLLLFILSTVFVTATGKAMQNVTLEEIYAMNPIEFYIELTIVILTTVLFLAAAYKKKKYENSDEYKHNMDYIHSVNEYAKYEFCIPEHARKIDILLFSYKMKKGKLNIIEKDDFSYKGYINAENCLSYCYVKEDKLYITNLRDEWAIPLHCITEIKMINQRMFVPQWNKEIKYNEGKYKKYNLEGNGNSQTIFDECCAVCILWNAQNYELLIPPYEEDEMKSLIGMW